MLCNNMQQKINFFFLFYTINIQVSVSEQIKNERLKRGLTIEELSNLLGVNKGTVSRWENGSLPKAKHRELLKNVLNIDLIADENQNNFEIKKSNINYADNNSSISQGVSESPLNYNLAIRTLSDQLDVKDQQIDAWVKVANSQVEQMNKLIEILSSKLLIS